MPGQCVDGTQSVLISGALQSILKLHFGIDLVCKVPAHVSVKAQRFCRRKGIVDLIRTFQHVGQVHHGHDLGRVLVVVAHHLADGPKRTLRNVHGVLGHVAHGIVHNGRIFLHAIADALVDLRANVLCASGLFLLPTADKPRNTADQCRDSCNNTHHNQQFRQHRQYGSAQPAQCFANAANCHSCTGSCRSQLSKHGQQSTQGIADICRGCPDVGKLSCKVSILNSGKQLQQHVSCPSGQLLSGVRKQQIDQSRCRRNDGAGVVSLHGRCNGRDEFRPDLHAFLAECRLEYGAQGVRHLLAHGSGDLRPHLAARIADGHPVLLDGIGKLYHRAFGAVLKAHGICQCPCKAHHRTAGGEQLVLQVVHVVFAQRIAIQVFAVRQLLLDEPGLFQLGIHVLQRFHCAQNAGRDALILRFSCLSAVFAVLLHRLLVGVLTVFQAAVAVDARQQVHPTLHPALFVLDDGKLRIQLVKRLLCNVILKLQALGLCIQIVVPGLFCSQVAFAVFLPQGVPLLLRLGFLLLLQFQLVLLVLGLPVDLVQL